MASVVIGSKIFADLFGQASIREVFSDVSTLQGYLDVEAALARVQAGLGIFPAEAADAIGRHARVDEIDCDELARRTRIVGYPILPLVEQLAERVEDGHGQWCHWGATTQDIMDTADVLQMRRALDLVAADLDAIAAALAALARDHAEVPMPGRTHLQHALPISFGYKAATWLSAIDRHRLRLRELRPRLEVISFAGAAGTLASLGAEQSRRARGEKLRQDDNVASGSLNERVLLYLGAIVFVGLLVVWATASSPWLLYGSLLLAIGLTVLWGHLRLARIRRIEAMRARQVEALQAKRDSAQSQ